MKAKIAVTAYFINTVTGRVYRPDPMLDLIIELHSKCQFIDFYFLDWHSLTNEENIYVYNLSINTYTRVNLREFNAVHVLKIGYGTCKELTLKEKWQQFLKNVSVLEIHKIPCINKVDVFRYAIEKWYLLTLSELEICTIPSQILSSKTEYEILLKEHEPADIIKPLNGECGILVNHISELDQNTYEVYQKQCDHILIQKYISDIQYGEKSLFFLNGVFWRSIIKIPHYENFRSNGRHFGASFKDYTPTSKEIKFSQNVLDAFPRHVDVARVDIISTKNNLMLMEIEVIDPGYYIDSRSLILLKLEEFYKNFLQKEYCI